jgi:hypothetical protein
MKKITTVAVFMLLLFQSKAQSVSANYVQQFVSESKSPFTNNNFTPYAASGFTVAFSQSLQKLPLNVNVSASKTRRKPPPLGLIKYPDPPVYSKYARDNNIEADSFSFSSSKSSSIDLLVGVGYILSSKENNKFVVTLNADFGVSFTDKVAVNYYFQRRLTRSVEQNKTQLIINPNVKATYFFTKSIGVNVIAGYHSKGGANAGVGLAYRLTFPKPGGGHY